MGTVQDDRANARVAFDIPDEHVEPSDHLGVHQPVRRTVERRDNHAPLAPRFDKGVLWCHGWPAYLSRPPPAWARS